MFISEVGRGLGADGVWDGAAKDRVVSTACSLGVESRAGFLGTGGAGLRLTLEVDDAMDAWLGELGSWRALAGGAPFEAARETDEV